MSACIQTIPSMSSSATLGEDSVGRVKLRLCFNGRFEQTSNQQGWKFVGAEYFNESIGYGVKYADFMFKLSEKFKAAVSVKYQAPGEELDPETLISVQDDADLKEMIEDYFSHLERPGTPSKTFRIKVFVFMAAEEPLTPDEIMEGQTFFSESHAVPPRVRTYRALDGRSSWGSTLSSTGTPCTRQQDVSTGDWLSSIGGPAGLAGEYAGDMQLQQLMASAAVSVGSDKPSSHPLDAAMEQEALDRMRMSVSYHHSLRLAADQYRLLHAASSWGGARGPAVQLLENDAENEEGDALDDEDESQLEEVIAAIAEDQAQRQQAAQQQLANLAPDATAVVIAGEVGSGGCSTVQPPSEEASLPADPWDMSEDVSLPHGGDANLVANLPSHISAFGEGSYEQPADIVAATERGARGVRFLDEGAGIDVQDIIAAAAQLPSHISAFGDDVPSDAQDACAALVGSDGTDTAATTNGGGVLERGGAYGRPRTQDSGFSLDGELNALGEQQGNHARNRPVRQDSGDSLASLPKLQPVHKLAKPDLKIIAKIGEGAFGEVSVASAPLYGTVAVKWLKSERFSKHFASFGREASLLADLNHPNVLRFYGVVTESAQDPTVIGIMTEYIRGGSLSSFLRMSHSMLPLRTRCELALAAANGLAYLHELRIVHFDLKPDNLLLDAAPAVVRALAGADVEEPVGIRIAAAAGIVERDVAEGSSANGSNQGGAAGAAEHWGTGVAAVSLRRASAASNAGVCSPSCSSRGAAGSGLGRSSSGPPGAHSLENLEVPVVKVADFGLSKHKLNSTYVSSCKDLRGTLPYMAPELVADPDRVSEKADVWSLGVVMWEMLTREIPFQDLPPQQILMGLMCGNLHLDIPEWCEPEWRGLLEACLEPSPGNRPSMRELARQLEAIRDQQEAQQAGQQQQAHAQLQLQPQREQQQQAVAPHVRGVQQQELWQQQQQVEPAPPDRLRAYPLQQQQQHLHQPQHHQQHHQIERLQQQVAQQSGLMQQQLAHSGRVEQQLAEQSGRVLWLENKMVQQQEQYRLALQTAALGPQHAVAAPAVPMQAEELQGLHLQAGLQNLRSAVAVDQQLHTQQAHVLQLHPRPVGLGCVPHSGL